MSSDKFALVNYGGSFQLDINSAADLEALRIMDEVFWMATSAPVFSLNCSKELITVLDKNKNGRILSSNVRDAALFLLDTLKSHQRIDQRSNAIAASDFNDSENAAKLKNAVIEILSNLGKKESDDLTLTDLGNIKDILKNGLTNGDGIIPPEHIENDELKNFTEDIILCLGSSGDVNGTNGVGLSQLEQFVQATEDYLNWKDSKDFTPEILPLHEKTAEAYQVFSDIRPKIDEYFKLCRVKQYNETLGRNTLQLDCKAEVFENTQNAQDYLNNAPLGPLSENSVLKINSDINPAYSEPLSVFSSKVLTDLLDTPVETLSETNWLKIIATFKPYEDWLGSRKGSEVKVLEEAKLRQYVDSDLPAQLKELINQDLELGEKLKVRSELEELIILQRGILDFSNNFISFPHLYDPAKRAMFEIGHLIIDGRIFNFNIPVENVDSHSKRAHKSGIYIMYLEITGSKEDKPFFICTPVTSRHLGLLGVDKRGVLFDLQGKEWDAKVIKVLNNPVSLTEAVLAPFRKLSQLLIDAVDKISNSTEKHLENKIGMAGKDIQKNLKNVPEKISAKKEPASSTARDLMLTGSVTFAALGSSFAYISSTFSSMNWEHRLATFSIGILVIVVPVVLVAAIKLHRRNISSILEASGWAINAHMRLTRRLASILAPRPDSPGRVFRKKRDILGSFSNKFKFRLKNK